MAILIRKFGRREYTYLVQRQGGKVVHTYLGPARDPSVAQKAAFFKKRPVLPQGLFRLFWDVNPQGLDLNKHYFYIIERILELGRLDALSWAQRVYPSLLILRVCETSRGLSQKSRNFWRLWFDAETIS